MAADGSSQLVSIPQGIPVLLWLLVPVALVVGLALVSAARARRRLNTVVDAAHDRDQKLADAHEIARLGSWEHDLQTGALSWSPEMYGLYGMPSDFVPTRASVGALVHPDDRAAFDAAIDRCLTTGEPLSVDYRVVRPDGETRWLHRRGEVTAWVDGEARRMSGTAQDITDRRRAEDALRHSEAELRHTLSLLGAALDATADGILVVDNEGRISSFNRRFVDMWQIPEAILASRDDNLALGHVLDALVDPDGFLAKVKQLYARPDAESNDTIEFKDGRILERESMAQRVGGEIVGRVWSFRDVTEQKRLERELAHQTFHDSLTGLANQALFRDRVEHALARTVRSGGDVAVLFVDLDNFKTVNDSLGHVVGDELLVGATARLRVCLRSGDTAARLGGDEFAVLIEDTAGTVEAATVAQRIIDSLRQPFVVADREVVVGASIGIAIDGSGTSADQVLRNADLAMYRAKGRGKARYEIYAPEMHQAAVERLELEADLRRALERDELRLHYQPIVDLSTGDMTGVEALLRWNHHVRGMVRPDVFIQIAEESGLINDIGRWVLVAACTQARRWQVDHERARPLRISVNLSPRQLHDDRIIDDVRSTLERSGLAPACLTLEITEGAMMHDADTALRHLTALKAIGVQLAVDDFGTGYSSLSYLQRFPIDELKVDRSFVHRIDHGPEESSLARAIVRLAETLHLRAVAEGVETSGQLDALRRLGCDRAQGFHLSRPQEPVAIDVLLTDAAPFDLGPDLAAATN